LKFYFSLSDAPVKWLKKKNCSTQFGRTFMSKKQPWREMFHGCGKSSARQTAARK
jgi:hypothetical protein